MDLTKTQLIDRCMLSSIAHAINTNLYPLFSYEKSWNANNFSINNSCGTRGTITFKEDFCVGAIRNEECNKLYCGENILQLAKDFPKKAISVLKDETLQYLLVDINDKITPCISSIFMCDNLLHFNKKTKSSLMRDLFTLKLAGSTEEAFWAELIETYKFDKKAESLLFSLYQKKRKDPQKKIQLTASDIQKIPGKEIDPECIVSFQELNIYF